MTGTLEHMDVIADGILDAPYYACGNERDCESPMVDAESLYWYDGDFYCNMCIWSRERAVNDVGSSISHITDKAISLHEYKKRFWNVPPKT